MHDTAATAKGWQMLSQRINLRSALYGDGSQDKQGQGPKTLKTLEVVDMQTKQFFFLAY